MLTRVIGRGPRIAIFFNGRQNKNFQTLKQILFNSIYLLISSAKRQVFLLFFNNAEATKKGRKSTNLKKYKFPPLLTKFASLLHVN